MRVFQRFFIDARLLLGGQVDNRKGRMHEVAERVLLASQSRQPMFLIGGFRG